VYWVLVRCTGNSGDRFILCIVRALPLSRFHFVVLLIINYWLLGGLGVRALNYRSFVSPTAVFRHVCGIQEIQNIFSCSVSQYSFPEVCPGSVTNRNLLAEIIEQCGESTEVWNVVEKVRDISKSGTLLINFEISRSMEHCGKSSRYLEVWFSLSLPSWTFQLFTLPSGWTKRGQFQRIVLAFASTEIRNRCILNSSLYRHDYIGIIDLNEWKFAAAPHTRLHPSVLRQRDDVTLILMGVIYCVV
jgi:hypothetical protein